MDEDVNEILRISLPRKPRMDEVIRHFDKIKNKKGHYSVKSRYQLALKIKNLDKSGC